MSAYVVSKKHIDLLVSVATNGTRDGIVPPSKHDPDALGQLLVSECVASVSYRYPDDKPGELPGPCDAYYVNPYRYADPQYRFGAAELYAAVGHYQYQSCEHPGWQGSEAFRLCEQVKRIIEAKLPAAARYRQMSDDRQTSRHGCHPWPEMDAAPWGWEETDVALRVAKTDPDGRCFLWALRAGDDETARAALSDWLIGKGLLSEPLGARDLDRLSLKDMEPPAALPESAPLPAAPVGGVHVRVYSGAGNGTITDMTHAGKRGKACRTLTFLGEADAVIDYLCTTPEQRAARGGCYALECRPLNEVRAIDFDALCAELRKVAASGCDFTERTIKGIHAPRPLLTAGVRGAWSASADETGVTLNDLDDVNQWTEITSKQQPTQAYALAAKVWHKVKAARTRREASDILSAAGCSLRGFCGMD